MAKPKLYDPEAEANLLACALVDGDNFLLDVAPDDFHGEQNARIWAAGQQLARSGTYIDPEVLHHELSKQDGEVSLTALTLLMARDVFSGNAPIWAAEVRELAQRRHALALIQRQAQALYPPNEMWKQALADVGAELLKYVTPKPASDMPKRQTSWDAAELLAAKLGEAHMLVAGLIPVGLTFLAGRPKIGKSWLGLQTAIAVSTGGQVLDRPVEQGRVLYVALEDNARRLQERTRRLHMPPTATIRFELAWPYLTHGGLELLAQAIADNPHALVVLDTLGRLLGPVDQQDLSEMTMVLGQLQALALEHDLAVLAIDHHKKPTGLGEANPIDDLIGSTAKSAVADGALGLSREQGQRNVSLKVVGRDVEWQDLVLSWDPATSLWQCLGTSEEVAQQGNRGRILEALGESGQPLTLTELAKAVGISHSNLHPLLNDLVAQGAVERLPKTGRQVPYRLRVPGASEPGS